MLTLVLTETAGAEKVAILSFSLGNFHHMNDSVPRDSWPISGQSSVFYPLKTSANLWSFTTVYCWFGHIYFKKFFVQCIHVFISHCSWDELHKNPFDVPKENPSFYKYWDWYVLWIQSNKLEASKRFLFLIFFLFCFYCLWHGFDNEFSHENQNIFYHI